MVARKYLGKNRIRSGLLEQFAPNSFACVAFEEDVVGHNDRGAAVLLQDREDVLAPQRRDEF